MMFVSSCLYALLAVFALYFLLSLLDGFFLLQTLVLILALGALFYQLRRTAQQCQELSKALDALQNRTTRLERKLSDLEQRTQLLERHREDIHE